MCTPCQVDTVTCRSCKLHFGAELSALLQSTPFHIGTTQVIETKLRRQEQKRATGSARYGLVADRRLLRGQAR